MTEPKKMATTPGRRLVMRAFILTSPRRRSHAPGQIRYLLLSSVCVVASFGGFAHPLPATAATPSLPPPFATLLFSRTEMTAADDCTPKDTGIARLDTEVAPYLASKGLTATGTLTPATIAQSVGTCTHYNDTIMGSWDDATNLANNYGWTFVSQTASYPPNLGGLTPAQSDAETCGSANAITAHGLPGANGFIAYPNNSGDPTALHTNYGSKCFAWGRKYSSTGITDSSAGTKTPYWQNTHAGSGGPCADTTQPCSRITMQNGSTRYTLPSDLIGHVNSLAPGQWFTFQSFVLVKDKNPAYSTGGVAWDCTSSNPALHWSNDNERYCYNDFKAVIAALVARGVQVTDPLTVGIAFGRPATYPTTALSDRTPPSRPTEFQADVSPTNSSVQLSWNRSTDNVRVTGYHLERSTDQTTWTILAASQTGTSHTDSTTAYNTRYFYRVKAVDAAGNSSPYATTTVVTPSPSVSQYITNTSMESGVGTGWAAYNPTSAIAPVVVPGGSKDGIYALKATNNTTTTAVAGLVDKAPHWVSSTSLNTTYTGSMWLSGAAGTVVTVKLRECNTAGTSCPGLSNVTATLPANGWIQARVAYKAKTSGHQLRFSASATLPAGGSFLADVFSLTSPAS